MKRYEVRVQLSLPPAVAAKYGAPAVVRTLGVYALDPDEATEAGSVLARCRWPGFLVRVERLKLAEVLA